MSAPRHVHAAFFGKMAAAMTHEMKNVLAIMRESRGLMEDLMEINADIDFPHKDRFLKSMDTLKAQLDRGVTITTRFNRFAHSPDEAVREVDCQEWAELICHLCLRHARSKELELKAGPAPDPALVVSTDPFLLLETLGAGIELLYEAAQPKSEATISCSPAEGGARFAIVSPGASIDQGSDAFRHFEVLAAELGATPSVDDAGEGLLLTLPPSLP